MKQVLFVCLGNICRSPTAHAVFEQLVADRGLEQHIRVDSAGTGDWHVGKPPDRRATEAAAQRGYRLQHLRARQVTPEDFHRFDNVLAMDGANLRDLDRLRPADAPVQPRLFLEYAVNAAHREVPDPYYGGEDGFEAVLDMVEDAAQGLLGELVRELEG